jgi:hypothetical protein
MKKTRSRKSRDTVPLSRFYSLSKFISVSAVMIGTNTGLNRLNILVKVNNLIENVL